MGKRRPSGDGLIRKRSDGRWEARIIVGHKENGNPIYRSVFAEKQGKLMPKLAELKEQYAGVELTENSAITLGEWLERWLEEYKKPILRQSTYTGYVKDIENHILPYLGAKKLTQLKTADIQKHYNYLLESGRVKDNSKGKGLANATVRGIHMVLREALDSAVREGLIPRNPADGTSPPKIHRKEKQVLTKEELEAFMKLIENDASWYDFFYTEMLTGMRAGEICGVRWEDFDEENRTLRVVRSVDFVHGELVIGETKTEDGKRTIYLPDSLWRLLAERKKKSFSEWIFPNLLKPELPLDPAKAYRQLKSILKKGNLPDIRLHDLRHTFTSHAANSGIAPKTLSEIVGHSMASFTLDHYAHVTSDMQKNAANIVTNYITDILGKELKPWRNTSEKSGEGTVRLRKDGRWEGRVVIGYDEKNLPKTKNVTAKTKVECLEKLEELKAELGTVTKKYKSDMTFGEWMDFWYQTYCKNTLKKSTQTTYEERIYKQIIPKIGLHPLNKVTTGTLDRFYAHLKADGRLVERDIYGTGLANSVIRSIHAHCRAALEKAVEEKLIRQNPAIGCKLPPKKTPEVKILTPEAMQKLLYQAQIEGFYEMFMLDLATGLRRGEIVGLQWKDINFETGTLSVTKQVRYVKGELKIEPPKTKASERSIILSPPVLEMLTEYKKTVNSIWLFPSPAKDEDVPRDPSACRKALARILKHAGCEHVPFHAMRHTFASNAFHYGMDVKTLASTIGHESVETTLNVYAHSSEQMKRDAARKIDEAIGTVLGANVAASDASRGDENGKAEEPADGADQPKATVFEPYKGKKRKPGTGYVKQLSANCWQGRYTPTVNGKRIARNVYAPTEEECEIKLAELIKKMKAEFGIR